MYNKQHNISLIKIKDAIIIAATLLLAAWLFLFFRMNSDKLTGVISENGAVLHTVEFESLEHTYEYSAGGVIIEISASGLRFLQSDCADEICVHAGLVNSAGDIAICAPNGIMIYIRGSGKGAYDAIAG